MKKTIFSIFSIIIFSMAVAQQPQQNQTQPQQKNNTIQIKFNPTQDPAWQACSKIKLVKKNKNNQNINTNFNPGFAYINKHTKSFSSQQDLYAEINRLKYQFSQSTQSYKCYKHYWSEFQKDKKSLNNSQLTRRQRKKLLRKTSTDSLNAMEYYKQATLLSLDAYKRTFKVFEKYDSILYALNQKKYGKDKQCIRKKIDSLIQLQLQNAQDNLVAADTLKNIKKYNKYVAVSQIYKKVFYLYIDKFKLSIGSQQEIAQLKNKQAYKCPRPKNTGGGGTQIRLAQLPANDFNFSTTETYLNLDPLEKKQLADVKARYQTLKNVDMSFNAIRQPDINDNINLCLASSYYMVYHEYAKLYQSALTYKRKTFDNLLAAAEALKAKGDAEYSSESIWLANILLAQAINLAEKEISRNFIGDDSVVYIPNIAATTNNKIQPTTQTRTNRNQNTSSQPSNNVSSSGTRTPQKKYCDGLYYYYNEANIKKTNETGSYYRIFLVQSTGNPIAKVYKDFLPISFKKLCNNSSLKNYYLGKYTSLTSARQAAAKLIKQLGLSRATIVYFKNGTPEKSYTLTKSQSYKYLNTSSSKTNTQTQSVTPAPATQQYGVQLLAVSKPLDTKTFNSTFKNIIQYNIKLTKSGSKYIYYIPANSFQKAQQIKNQIKAKGFKDAFIVKFTQGKPSPAYR